MFRQVISIRWADGVTEDQKQAYRNALDGLRAIPELLKLKWGDDARIFEGNFDFVGVMDFADFPSARRYVEDPRHPAYIHDHAQVLIGERIVVQHEWTCSGGGTAVAQYANTCLTSRRHRTPAGGNVSHAFFTGLVL